MDHELLHGVSPSMRTRLLRAGFRELSDLRDLSPMDLAKELRCAPDEALAVIRVAQQANGRSTDVLPENAAARLRDETARRGITTMSRALDSLLAGGVGVGRLTELCGAPGTGKTQLCMQLCISCCLPDALGGAGGEAVYIDTEGSFLPERALEMTRRTLADLGCAGDETLENTVLDGVHYMRVHDHVEQLAAVNTLGDLAATGRVRLIVIDSVAFHFRYDFTDMALRTRLLNGMAQTLARLAQQHRLAVVLINQMTTKIGDEMGSGGGGQERAAFVPALGESWGHACAVRVVLYWDGNVRHAYLFKSPAHSEGAVPYLISASGVRDVPEPAEGDDGEDRGSKRSRHT